MTTPATPTPPPPSVRSYLPQQAGPGMAPGPAVPPAGYTAPPVYYGVPPAPPPLAPAGQRLAEFSDRLLARLIDGAILGGITMVIIVPVYVLAVLSFVDDLATATAPVDYEVGVNPAITTEEMLAAMLPLLGVFAVLMLLSLLLAYLYEVELMFRSGQSLGKRIMKIQVIPVEPGRPLTRGLAAKRYLVQHVAAAFVPGLNWLDGLWQLWDKPYRQCLHDKFARTVVIKLNP
ncbi:MAG TPA: RDD family protein [Micromonosporaceae bacterium]